MKKILFLVIISATFLACDKTYVCNCGSASGGLPYKKYYMNAKTYNGAERKCDKKAEAGEACQLQ